MDQALRTRLETEFKLTPTQLAALTSLGVETAADFSLLKEHHLVGVGFTVVLANRLLQIPVPPQPNPLFAKLSQVDQEGSEFALLAVASLSDLAKPEFWTNPAHDLTTLGGLKIFTLRFLLEDGAVFNDPAVKARIEASFQGDELQMLQFLGLKNGAMKDALLEATDNDPEIQVLLGTMDLIVSMAKLMV